MFAKIAARWRCGPPHLCCARYPAQPDPFSPSDGGAEPPLCPDVPASRSVSSFPLVQRPVGYVQSPALWCERQSVTVCVSPLPHNLYMACTCPGNASCHRALYRLNLLAFARPAHAKKEEPFGSSLPFCPYSITLVTTPAPTVRPPSRIANRNPSSIAIGVISLIVIWMLSPGITISTPSGNSITPVTSVGRK